MASFGKIVGTDLKKTGFTLVEVLLVATIIGILAIAAFANYRTQQIKARDAQRKSDLERIKTALETYKADNDVYSNDFDQCDSSIGRCSTDVSGQCQTATCNPGNNWGDLAGGIFDSLKNKGYISGLPIDPLNNTTYYYRYNAICHHIWPEPTICGLITVDCSDNQINGQDDCCAFELTAQLEDSNDPDFPTYRLCSVER